jgi:hypothetical protein
MARRYRERSFAPLPPASWGTAAILVLAAASPASAGKLDEARAEVRSGSSGACSSGSSSSSSESDDDEEDPAWDRDAPGGPRRDGPGRGILDVLEGFSILPLLPMWVPMWAAERAPLSDDGITLSAFLPYPYWEGRPGRMVVARDTAEDPLVVPPEVFDPAANPLGTAPWFAMRFSGEYAYDVDGLHRPAGSFLIEVASIRLGLETAWSGYLEPLPDGTTDRLVFGDVNLFFRNAQHERFEFRFGLGANLMIDAEDVDAGVNATWQVDLFPVRPLVLSVSADVGNLGYAFVAHLRGAVGVMLSRLELFAGYDARWVGSVLFHGPLAGARIWF